VPDALTRLRELAVSPASRPDRARAAAELIRAGRGYHWVGLYDVTATEITAIAWTGVAAPANPAFPVTQGLNGAAVASRRPVVVQDVSKDHRYLTTFRETRAEAAFPVTSPDGARVVGTIDVESDRVDAFTAEDEDFLRRCAESLAPLWASS
jgi:GAF domain-containing protein